MLQFYFHSQLFTVHSFSKELKKNSNMVMIITVPSKQQFDMFILHLLSIVVKFLLIE